MINEGGNVGWERFRKRQGKTLRKMLNKFRKQEKNKALQFKTFGNKKVAKDAVRARESFQIKFTEADGCWDGYKKAGMKKKGKKLVPNCVPEGIGAAYMPQADKAGVPEREITSKAVKKQLNRNRNRNVMKGDLETPHVRYIHSRDKSTDYINPKKRKRFKKKVKEEYPPGAEADMNKLYKHKTPSAKTMDAMYKDHKKSEKEKMRKKMGLNKEGTYDNYSKRRVPPRVPGDNVKHQMRPKGMSAGEAGRRKLAKVAQGDQNRKLAKAYGIREADGDIKKRLQDKSNRTKDAAMVKKMQKVAFAHRESVNEDLSKADKGKMDQLFRMGLAKKGELALMQRAMKRGPDAMKDPKLRSKLYDLLVKLTDLVTKDGQTFVKVRQNVQRNKKELQAVKELLHYRGRTILEVNKSFELINIPEDMSGMSVSSGHKRSVKQGAGMTKKGVAAYRRRNPGSKLQTAVTTPPSKLKKGSKAANRRKAFCSRSRSWTSERGRAARRRWNC